MESYYELVAAGVAVDEATRRAMEFREAAKHTLGNLTLLNTSLNPSVGNKGWPIKKPRIGKSLLALNRDVAEHEAWNEDSILARSAKLAAAVNGIWVTPQVVSISVAAA